MLRDQRDERAADDGGVGVGGDFGDVLRPRDAEAERDRQRRVRADPPHQRLGARGDRSRAPVTPSREMPYRNPRPSSAAFRIRASVVVGLSRKIVSRPAAASVSRKPPASSIGRSSASTPSTPADAAAGRTRSTPMRSKRVRVAEDHDRRGDAGPDRRDQRQRRPQAAARRQRALGRALDDRAVGQRIGERHADLETSAPARSSACRISPERGRSGSPAVV